MKVLQIASSGMEFFHEQVRILERHGVDCDAVSYRNGFRSERLHDFDNAVVREALDSIAGHNPLYYGYRGAALYPRILRKALETDYDVVHLNSGMVAPLGLLQPERPVVLTLWGDDLLGDRLYGQQSKITRFCARRCSSVIVRNEEMARALPCDAHVIPSGVDMEKFSPMDREEARRRLGWDPDTHHVLFPYPEIQDKKRHPVAKEVVETVSERLDRVVQLQSVSNVPHDRMPLYYNASDLLLLPSTREGSPNTVKEAMACNVPVVSTDVGDVRERLGPVSNSYVCSADSALADAVESVLVDGSRSDGRTYVEPLSLERMGERLVDIYESVLQASN